MSDTTQKWKAFPNGESQKKHAIQSSYAGCPFLNENYEKLGIPGVIAGVEDRLCDMIPINDVESFATNFLELIKIGDDLMPKYFEFCLWILLDKTHGVRQFTKRNSPEYLLITQYSELLIQAINGNVPSEDEWRHSIPSPSQAE